MGCWYETCGITGLPILRNDNVVMVVPDERNMDGFFENPSVKLIEFGTYNEYGWINELERNEEEYKKRDDLKSIFFHRFAWDFLINDKELQKCALGPSRYIDKKIETRNRIHSRNFDSDAMREWVLATTPWLTSFDKWYNKDFNIYKDLITVMYGCVQLRRNPFDSINVKGSQTYDLRLLKEIHTRSLIHVNDTITKHEVDDY